MKLKVGSDFSGVGAFDQALIRLGIEYETVFSCDMDKYARQSYIANYGEPKYYPLNVYDRDVPKESLDIYMSSPPCQSFSLAGKREGEKSDKGILFYNTHKFIKKNKPRFFILENVKGLLSDDKGRTFKKWCKYLGGKSMNGNMNLFPEENSVPYHIYFKVLNARKYGVPQNRERIFIIGIRDDEDNNFSFPKEIILNKRLKDVLEDNVPDNYYLSDRAVKRLCYNDSGFISKPKNINDIASTICSSDYKLVRGMNVLQVNKEVVIGAIRGRNKENLSDRSLGSNLTQTLEINTKGVSNTLTSVQKDNVVVDSETIRRLTPRECFRLMDFTDSFKLVCSDTQLYKQAGNSIVVNVLALIIKKLKL